MRDYLGRPILVGMYLVRSEKDGHISIIRVNRIQDGILYADTLRTRRHLGKLEVGQTFSRFPQRFVIVEPTQNLVRMMDQAQDPNVTDEQLKYIVDWTGARVYHYGPTDRERLLCE